MSGNNYSNTRAPVKVVIIDTHFVEITARSFKSVVQELTGKDSTVADNGGVPASQERLSGRGCQREADLLRDLSFEELETLISEMPPVEELHRYLWADC